MTDKKKNSGESLSVAGTMILFTCCPILLAALLGLCYRVLVFCAAG